MSSVKHIRPETRLRDGLDHKAELYISSELLGNGVFETFVKKCSVKRVEKEVLKRRLEQSMYKLVSIENQ